ncbi:hypothetical protein BD413DRAFT_236082 [Trametes elegans]|nr:hypothetical protein BD413DRAFT_236082 [Trametes elegans]
MQVCARPVRVYTVRYCSQRLQSYIGTRWTERSLSSCRPRQIVVHGKEENDGKEGREGRCIMEHASRRELLGGANGWTGMGGWRAMSGRGTKTTEAVDILGARPPCAGQRGTASTRMDLMMRGERSAARARARPDRRHALYARATEDVRRAGSNVGREEGRYSCRHQGAGECMA